MTGTDRLTSPDALLTPRRSLFAFPHPDDEIFSCLALLQRIAEAGNAELVHAVWLTRGWPQFDMFSRDDDYWVYRQALDAEHEAVMARMAEGLVNETHVLDIASRELPARADQARLYLEELHRANGYDAILSCPLEGAHPDHDMTNTLCGALARTWGIEAWEYTSYHLGPDEQFRNNVFLFEGGPEMHIPIDEAHADLKEEVRRAYSSEPSLAAFTIADERFRPVIWPPTFEVYERSEPLFYETWPSGVNRTDVHRAMQRWI